MLKHLLPISLILLVHTLLGQTYSDFIEMAKSHEANDPDSVLFYASEALKLDRDGIDAAYWMGVGLRYKNQNDSAMYWYKLYSEKAESDVERGNAYMGVGGIQYANRSFAEALVSFGKAAELFDKAENPERLASSYVNIGILNGLTGNERKAKAYYLESIEIFEKLNNLSKALPSLVNLAEIYQHQKLYDSAIYYAQRCYDIGDSLGLSFAKARALYVLSPSYIRSGMTQVGYRMAIEAKKLFESLGIESSANSMQYYQAEALFEMGQLDKSLAICRELESGFYSFPEQLFALMAKVAERQGNFAQALDYQKKFHSAYEEYERELNSEQINRLEAQFETQRKENEILKLKTEVSLQELESDRKNQLLIFAGIISFLLLATFWFYYQKRISKEREKTAIHKQQLLRSQINPHFIFNSLSSIRGFLFKAGDTQPAILYLGKFAKLMRMVLDLSSKEWVSLEEELKALELYLEIQQIRFNKAFSFDFFIDESLDPKAIIVPPLTAQPFIENAIEHGFKGIKVDGKVEVACLKKSGKLVFQIQDNGIGIDHVEPRANHQSRAIQIFKERIELIGSGMKTKFSFHIADIGNDSDRQGTRVTYELPLIKV